MFCSLSRACLLAVTVFFFANSLAFAAETVGPWNLDRLYQVPQATWGAQQGLIREVYYAGEPYQGHPTRVFAYYARPAEGKGPFPGMVLVHGGGGTAFAEWAELWAKRGYAAIAMDLAGCGPERKRLEDGGPDQSAREKFPEFTKETTNDVWTYHAIANVVKAHSLLAAQEEVDPDRIGVTGISWGGYLTCIAAGVDHRFKVAVPVYGCGFLNHNSAWKENALKRLTPQTRERWLALFDPSQYLTRVKCPILFVNGTNDFAYPLDSYQLSYSAVPGDVDLCIRVRMRHGHPAGWAPAEIGRYVDSVLEKGTPLPTIEEMKVAENTASAAFTAKVPISKGELHYATATGPWPQREWKTVPATVKDGQVQAELPSDRPLIFYLSITDNQDCLISAPHQILGESQK